MALIPHACFDECAFRLDDATGKVHLRLDPTGRLSCGPNGLSASFSQTFEPVAWGNGTSVGIPSPMGGIGVISPATGAITVPIDGTQDIVNGYPGTGLLYIWGSVERLSVSNASPDVLTEATVYAEVSPLPANPSYPYTMFHEETVYSNGGGGFAAIGRGSGTHIPGWYMPQGATWRPQFRFRVDNRGAGSIGLIRGGTIRWNYLLLRRT